jgi:hypothetical protein
MTSLTFWPAHIHPGGPLSLERIEERRRDEASGVLPADCNTSGWKYAGQCKSPACHHDLGPQSSLRRNGSGHEGIRRYKCRRCLRTFSERAL